RLPCGRCRPRRRRTPSPGRCSSTSRAEGLPRPGAPVRCPPTGPAPAPPRGDDEKGRLPRGGTGPSQEPSAVTRTARGSLGALEDLHQTPPLGRGGRAGLHDEDTVADAGGVLLVVSLELARLRRDLAVAGVLHTLL